MRAQRGPPRPPRRLPQPPARLDGIRGGSELVGRHVSNGRGLTGGVRRMPSGAPQVPGRGVGMTRRRARRGHADLTPRPGAAEVDRLPRTVVARPRQREVLQDVLRAVGRPEREKAVIVVRQAAARDAR